MDESIPLQAFDELLKCGLCAGFIIDAVALPECHHEFCRSCAVKYFGDKARRPAVCPNPSCRAEIHQTKPFSKLKNDAILQSVIYKLRPDVYQNEMRRRKDFWQKNKDLVDFSGDTLNGVPYRQPTKADLGEPEDGHLYVQETPALLKVQLTYDAAFANIFPNFPVIEEDRGDGTLPELPVNDDTLPGDFSELSPYLKEKDAAVRAHPSVYLCMPGEVPVSHVRDLLAIKFTVIKSMVFLVYSQTPLKVTQKIADVQRFYGRKADPSLNLSFVFVDTSMYPDEISQEAFLLRTMRKKPLPILPRGLIPEPRPPVPTLAVATAEGSLEPPCSGQPTPSSSPSKSEKLGRLLLARKKEPKISSPIPENSSPFPLDPAPENDEMLSMLRTAIPVVFNIPAPRTVARIDGIQEPIKRRRKRKPRQIPGEDGPLVSVLNGEGKVKRKRKIAPKIALNGTCPVDNEANAAFLSDMVNDDTYTDEEKMKLMTRWSSLNGSLVFDPDILRKQMQEMIERKTVPPKTESDGMVEKGGSDDIKPSSPDGMAETKRDAVEFVGEIVKKKRIRKKKSEKGSVATGQDWILAGSDHTYARRPYLLWKDRKRSRKNAELERALQPTSFHDGPTVKTEQAPSDSGDLRPSTSTSPSTAGFITHLPLSPVARNLPELPNNIVPLAETEPLPASLRPFRPVLPKFGLGLGLRGPKHKEGTPAKWVQDMLEARASKVRIRRLRPAADLSLRMLAPKPAKSGSLFPYEANQPTSSGSPSASLVAESMTPSRNGVTDGTGNHEQNGVDHVAEEAPLVEQKKECTLVTLPSDIWDKILSNSKSPPTMVPDLVDSFVSPAHPASGSCSL